MRRLYWKPLLRSKELSLAKLLEAQANPALSKDTHTHKPALTRKVKAGLLQKKVNVYKQNVVAVLHGTENIITGFLL